MFWNCKYSFCDPLTVCFHSHDCTYTGVRAKCRIALPPDLHVAPMHVYGLPYRVVGCVTLLRIDCLMKYENIHTLWLLIDS